MMNLMEAPVMTKDEMNTQMQDLRNRVSWLRTEIMAVEHEMDCVSKEYINSVLRKKVK